MTTSVGVEESSLQIQLSEVGRLELSLAGAAEGPTDELGAALTSLHQRALATKAREVTVDLLGLEFATSSSLKAFVTWLQAIHELEPEAQYRVLVKSSTHHAWQARSLRALKAFAGEIMEVREDA
jgi:hypothetical protein